MLIAWQRGMQKQPSCHLYLVFWKELVLFEVLFGENWLRYHSQARSIEDPWRAWIALQEWARSYRRAWSMTWCLKDPFWSLCRWIWFEGGRVVIGLTDCFVVGWLFGLFGHLLRCCSCLTMIYTYFQGLIAEYMYLRRQWGTKLHLVFISIARAGSVCFRFCYVLGQNTLVLPWWRKSMKIDVDNEKSASDRCRRCCREAWSSLAPITGRRLRELRLPAWPRGEFSVNRKFWSSRAKPHWATVPCRLSLLR